MSTPEETTAVTDADLKYLAARNLLIPAANVTASQSRDSFNQARSEGREHDAIDIMAPGGTPVLATTDGVVTKLFQSDRGGVTLYELDLSGRYVYYCAHLMRYAEGIAEGKQLRRGDVIAYVGDTGNIKKGLDAGAQAYLVKPNFDNLKATIDRLIDEAGLTHSVMM